MWRKLFFFLIGVGLVFSLSTSVKAADPVLSARVVEMTQITGKTSYVVRWEYTITPFDKKNGWKVRIITKNAKLLGTITPTTAKGEERTAVDKADIGNQFAFQLLDKKGAILGKTAFSAPTVSGSGTPVPSCAQGTAYTFCNTLFGNVTASEYFQRFYAWAVGIAIIGASLMIIYAGYKYTMSRGNPGEISNAKEIIYSTLLGVVLLLLSYSILKFLGINLS